MLISLNELTQILADGDRLVGNLLKRSDSFVNDLTLYPQLQKSTDSRIRSFFHVDNLQAMAQLIKGSTALPSLASGIDLIYIDPPFHSKADYKINIKLGEKDAVLGRTVYSDTWSDGAPAYLRMLYPRLKLMHHLLSDTGSIFVHIDWHIGHYVKLLLDHIFGEKNFVNEIIWSYRTGGVPARGFARKHDVIFFYSKTKKYFFKPMTENTYIPTLANRVYAKESLGAVIDTKGCGTCGQTGQWMKPSTMRDVWEITPLFRNSRERVNYATQKPEALISRIIESACPENGIVADFFCGSGTTALVAENYARQWIVSDIGRHSAISVNKRLINTVNGSIRFYRSKQLSATSDSTIDLIFFRTETELIIELNHYQLSPSIMKSLSSAQQETLSEISDFDSLLLLDYWGIDMAYNKGSFQETWRTFRPGVQRKGDPSKIVTSAGFSIQKVQDSDADHCIACRFVDILGNEILHKKLLREIPLISNVSDDKIETLQLT